MARLRALVVGAGSVGLDVAQRLCAAGLEHVGVMDFDTVEVVNLDRMIGATRTDARRHRSNAVAQRLMRAAATAARPKIIRHEMSICEPEGLRQALDYDIIFSCVDRPWPGGVLNTVAHADLIPVIDGGIAVDAFADGAGMRGATWRYHVIRPGRPCMLCNGQLAMNQFSLDRSGALDDPTYIEGLDPGLVDFAGAPNVALLAGSVSSALLALFVSFVVAPGGQGEPGPLQYHLGHHGLERLSVRSSRHCHFENQAKGDEGRIELVGEHRRAREEILRRTSLRRGPVNWLCELVDRLGIRPHR